MDVVELAAAMRHACSFVDVAGAVQMSKAGVGIGLQYSAKILEVPLLMLALSIWRVGEPDGGRRSDAGGTIIPNVSPQVADLGASAPWREHRTRPRNWESGKRSKRLRLLHRLKQSLQLQHPHRHPGGSR